MVAVLDAARRLGATTSRLLQYADSGDVSGDKSSVVGYMAAAIW
jgi:AmmeMemoRadiSam system protein B